VTDTSTPLHPTAIKSLVGDHVLFDLTKCWPHSHPHPERSITNEA